MGLVRVHMYAVSVQSCAAQTCISGMPNSIHFGPRTSADHVAEPLLVLLLQLLPLLLPGSYRSMTTLHRQSLAITHQSHV